MIDIRIRRLIPHAILDLLLTFAVAGLAGIIWQKSGIPETRLPALVWIGLFSSSLLIFSFLTSWISLHHPAGRKLVIKSSYLSWTSLLFLGLLITWRIWNGWNLTLTCFYFGYIILRFFIIFLAFQQINTQDEEKIFAGVLIAACLCTTPLFLRTTDIVEILQAVAGSLLNVLIGLSLRRLARKFEYRQWGLKSCWPNWAALIFLLSIPLISHYSKPGWFQVMCLGTIVFLLVFDRSEAIFVRWGYTSLAIAMIVPALVGVEFIGIIAWVFLLALFRILNHKTPQRFIQVTGVSLLMLVSVSLSVLLQSSAIAHAEYFWPLRINNVLFSTFLDLNTGVLFNTPWMFLCLLGFAGYWFSPKRDLLIGIGPCLVLIPIVIISNIRTGHGPSPDETLIFNALMWPYALVVLNDGFRPLTKALTQMITAITLASSYLYLCSISLLDQYVPGLNSLLTAIDTASDLDLAQFFPSFNQLSYSLSNSFFFWVAFILFTGFALIIERKLIAAKSNPVLSDTLLTLMTAIIIMGFGYAAGELSVWERVETSVLTLSNNLPKQTIAISNGEEVIGVRIDSWLSSGAYLKQGYPAGILKVVSQDGLQEEYPLRAGIEIAETAYDRPDVVSVIRHHRPEVSRTWQAYWDNGLTYPVNSYRSEFILSKPQKLAFIEIQRDKDLGESNSNLHIGQISLKKKKDIDSWGHPYPVQVPSDWTLNLSKPAVETQVTSLHRYKEILIVSRLANAAELPDGTLIGTVEISGWENESVILPVRVGYETSEWSYDRPDLQGRVRHSKARIAFSKRQKDADGRKFLGHSYVMETKIKPPLEPKSIKILYGVKEELCPNCEWTISTMTFK